MCDCGDSMPITHPEVTTPPPDRRAAASVLVQDLEFYYPDGHHALRGITVVLRPGEKVALVGPNGAGKSTFMLHLNGLLQGRGEITIAGLALRKESLPEIRGKVGLVFQNPDDQLFSPTVFDDVAFGPLHMGLDEDTVRERVARALDAVGMSEMAGRMPHHMSMGQKKRVAIATVLAMEPEILVLDEPTAGLDPRGRRRLIELLRGMEITMLVSTHDLALVAELFPRTLIMDEGRLRADGSTAEILDDGALLERHGLERPWSPRPEAP